MNVDRCEVCNRPRDRVRPVQFGPLRLDVCGACYTHDPYVRQLAVVR